MYLYRPGLFKEEQGLSPSKQAVSNKTTSLEFRPQGLNQQVGGAALSFSFLGFQPVVLNVVVLGQAQLDAGAVDVHRLPKPKRTAVAMSAESLVSYTGERAADLLPVSGDGIFTKFRQLLKETLSWYNSGLASYPGACDARTAKSVAHLPSCCRIGVGVPGTASLLFWEKVLESFLAFSKVF